jgi:hypothetical protein
MNSSDRDKIHSSIDGVSGSSSADSLKINGFQGRLFERYVLNAQACLDQLTHLPGYVNESSVMENVLI